MERNVSMNKKLLLSAAVLAAVAGNACIVPVYAAPQPPAQGKYMDPAADLNRTRDYLERQRVAQEIEENRHKTSKVEGQAQQEQKEQTSQVKFSLKDVRTNKSAVLTDAELAKITDSYRYKEITIKELYEMVERINKLYTDKGYITCRAFLKAQTIKDGTVHITLVEGATGEKTVSGNIYTKEKYVLDRVHLDQGKIANVNTLNKDLLRFNATNDAQLRLVMKAGKSVGTTDYELQLIEPKQYNFSTLVDNAGNYTSGEFRVGAFYGIKSVFGHRDNLNVGVIGSQGTDALSIAYSRNAGLSGTKLNFAYSTNAVKTVKGVEDYNTKGHASSYSVGITQPWIICEHTRSEVSFDFNVQDSKSDFMANGLRGNMVNDRINDFTLSFAMTSYGNDYVAYQKLGYTRGHFSSNADMFANSSGVFGLTKYDGMFQKIFPHSQMISLRGSLQWSSNAGLPSAKQFFLGGMYTVRGYKESYISADCGLNLSAEYLFPVSKDKSTNGVLFVDYGRTYDESGESASGDHILMSVGAGIKANLSTTDFLSIMVATPLKRHYYSKAETVSNTRVHLMFTKMF